MAITAYGYEGEIGQTQWARLTGMLGVRHAVDSLADLAVAAVAGTRRVGIGPGRALGYGVVVESSSTVFIDLPTPAGAGQWFLIALRRNWGTKANTFECIAGAVTTSAIAPVLSPGAYPAAMNSTPGVADDQPLAWVWASGTSTVLSIFDIRDLDLEARFAKGLSTVRGAEERDLRFRQPLQGDGVYRADLGCEERYFDTYHPISNPGGAGKAGWYPTGGIMPFVAFRNTGYDVNSGLEGLIQNGTILVEEDRRGWMKGAPNPWLVTPKIAGWYDVLGQFQFPNHSSGMRFPSIKKNGGGPIDTFARVANTAYPLGNGNTIVTGRIFMNGETDSFGCYIYQDSGPTLTGCQTAIRITYAGPGTRVT